MVEIILNAGKLAPTAKNNQPQMIYVLRSKEAIEKINSICRCIFGASTVFVVCYDENITFHSPLNPGQSFGEIDASIVCTHMMLEAANIGLGSCWVGMFGKKELADLFILPENIIPVAVLPVGFIAEDCVPSERHTMYRPDEEMIKLI